VSPVAENYVTIRIKADDTAKPDLTDLKAKLDELGAKVDTAKVDVDDEDASEKLLRLNARLAKVNEQVANPRIKVAGAARAEADILAIEHELDKLSGKSATAGGDLSKLNSTAKDVLDKLDNRAQSSGKTGLIGKILFGGGEDGAGDGEDLISKIQGLPVIGSLLGPMGLAIVPAIGAALVEVTGLVSGLAAAGAGAGSFALLAIPAVKKVETAYTNLNAAQAAYQTAQAKYAADPTKTNATAAASALDSLKAQQKLLSEMSPQEQGAITGVQKLVAEFGKLSRAFEPEAFKVFSSGLQLVDKLLPDIVPFAKTFADVVSQLLGQARQVRLEQGVHGIPAAVPRAGGPGADRDRRRDRQGRHRVREAADHDER
jgi:hypothetical protein